MEKEEMCLTDDGDETLALQLTGNYGERCPFSL